MLGRFAEIRGYRVSIGQETLLCCNELPALRPSSLVFNPQLASAQEVPLSEVLVRLIQSEIVLAGPPPGSPFISHAAHFVPGEDQQLTPFLFNQAIVSQLATLPVGFVVRRLHLHVRLVSGHLRAEHQQLRPVVCRACADDWPPALEHGCQLPARVVQHASKVKTSTTDRSSST